DGVLDVDGPVRFCAEERDDEVIAVGARLEDDVVLSWVLELKVDRVEQIVVLVVDLIDRGVESLDSTRWLTVSWNPVEVPVSLDDGIARPEGGLKHGGGDLADPTSLGRDRLHVVALLGDAVAPLVAGAVAHLSDRVIERECLARSDHRS